MSDLTDDETHARTVVLAGEYDIGRTAELRDAILEGGVDAGLVQVDIDAVTFMDSSALRALLEVSSTLERDGTRLVLVRVPANVRRLLEVTGMNETFGVEPRPTD